MSHSTYLDITFTNNVNAIEVFNALLEYGWTLDDHGGVSYLPLGDKDLFGWQHGKLSYADVMALIKAKQESREIIGISLTWKDTNIGGNFLLYTDEPLLMVSLSINRKTIVETGDTDKDWYIPKIIPALVGKGIPVKDYIVTES